MTALRSSAAACSSKSCGEEQSALLIETRILGEEDRRQTHLTVEVILMSVLPSHPWLVNDFLNLP